MIQEIQSDPWNDTNVEGYMRDAWDWAIESVISIWTEVSFSGKDELEMCCDFEKRLITLAGKSTKQR